ncbi:unnamed protein product [Merluccius merluccius]
MEDIGLVVGEKAGHGSVNSAVVIFLDQVEKVNRIVETGIKEAHTVKAYPRQGDPASPCREVMPGPVVGLSAAPVVAERRWATAGCGI